MFGLGFWELAAITVVAFIVIKPKDLPVVVRNLGRLYNKATELYRGLIETLESTERQIKREIKVARDDVLREAESETQLVSAREPDSPTDSQAPIGDDYGNAEELQKCSEQQKS